MRASRSKNDGSNAGGGSMTTKFDDVAAGLADIRSGELAHAASWSRTRANDKRMASIAEQVLRAVAGVLQVGTAREAAGARRTLAVDRRIQIRRRREGKAARRLIAIRGETLPTNRAGRHRQRQQKCGNKRAHGDHLLMYRDQPYGVGASSTRILLFSGFEASQRPL